MSEKIKLNRRDFLKASAVAAAGIALQACAKTPTEAPTQAVSEPTATQKAAEQPTATQKAAEQPTPTSEPEVALEAPMWADMVSGGSLEPLAERLPQDPMVVEPFHEMGQFSKDVHRTLTGASDLTGYRVIVRDNLVCWNFVTGRLTIEDNLASKWELTPDAKEYTFHLRKGLKWNDGQPLTVDDFLFYYEDMVLNEEMTPTFPAWLSSGGKPGTFEKLDDYTLKVSFEAPYSLVPQYLCFRFGSIDTFCPKHFLSQFHPSYADKEALDKAVKDAGFDEWYQLFSDRINYTIKTDVPIAKAWAVTIPFPGQQMVSDRNPYYWKVDTDGKQLPYFDQLMNDYAADDEAIALKVINGEVDFEYRHMGYSNYPLYKEHEQDGNYRVLQWIGGEFPAFYFNLNVKDPELKKLFHNRDFRYALSYGIDRQEINDLMYFGQAIPASAGSWKDDPYWLPEFNQIAIEFDPDKANALLDGVGLDQKDSEGFRLQPDGKRLELLLSCYPSEVGVPGIDIFTKVAEYWQTHLNIKSAADEVERSLWSQRALAGEMMLPAYDADSSTWVVDPSFYVPQAGGTYWAPMYGVWYATGGEGGEEPTPELKEQHQLYEDLKSAADPAKQLELGQEILRRFSQALWVVGMVKLPFQPMIAHNTVVNVLEEAPAQYRNYHESITWPSQLWRKA